MRMVKLGHLTILTCSQLEVNLKYKVSPLKHVTVAER